MKPILLLALLCAFGLSSCAEMAGSSLTVAEDGSLSFQPPARPIVITSSK